MYHYCATPHSQDKKKNRKRSIKCPDLLELPGAEHVSATGKRGLLGPGQPVALAPRSQAKSRSNPGSAGVSHRQVPAAVPSKRYPSLPTFEAVLERARESEGRQPYIMRAMTGATPSTSRPLVDTRSRLLCFRVWRNFRSMRAPGSALCCGPGPGAQLSSLEGRWLHGLLQGIVALQQVWAHMGYIE